MGDTNHLPQTIMQHLQSATNIIIHASLQADLVSWVGSTNGNLSFQTTWNLVRSRAIVVPQSSLLWNMIVNLRISCFVWRLIHKRTPMQNCTRSIGVQLASRCALCYSNEDSEMHLFFSCSFSRNLWCWILSFIRDALPYQFLVLDSIIHLGNSSLSLFPISIMGSHVCRQKRVRAIVGSIVFLHLINMIWHCRNEVVFNNKSVTQSLAMIRHLSDTLQSLFGACLEMFKGRLVMLFFVFMGDISPVTF